jgi:hypothetical protein
MLQATVRDCVALDPLAFAEDGLSASEIDVRRGRIVEALVMAGMVAMRHEGGRARQCSPPRGPERVCPGRASKCDGRASAGHRGAAGGEFAQRLRIWNSPHLTRSFDRLAQAVRASVSRKPAARARSGTLQKTKQYPSVPYCGVLHWGETERGTPDVCWEARSVSREDAVDGLVVFAPSGSNR